MKKDWLDNFSVGFRLKFYPDNIFLFNPSIQQFWFLEIIDPTSLSVSFIFWFFSDKTSTVFLFSRPVNVPMIVPHCVHGSCPTWKSVLRATGLPVSRPPSPDDLLFSREGRQTHAPLLPQMQRRKPRRVRLTNTTPGAFTPSHPQQEVVRSSFDSTLVLIKDFSIPPFFHLLKLQRSRPPGLSLALNLSVPPHPLSAWLCLVTSKSPLWRGSAHSATLLVVFWWDWKAFQSGLRCEGIFPSTHLCSSAGHGFHHAGVRCWACGGMGGSHHCGLILIILPYGGWLPHNHP